MCVRALDYACAGVLGIAAVSVMLLMMTEANDIRSH